MHMGCFVSSNLHVEMVKTIAQAMRTKHFGIFHDLGTLGWRTTCLTSGCCQELRPDFTFRVGNPDLAPARNLAPAPEEAILKVCNLNDGRKGFKR